MNWSDRHTTSGRLQSKYANEMYLRYISTLSQQVTGSDEVHAVCLAQNTEINIRSQQINAYAAEEVNDLKI